MEVALNIHRIEAPFGERVICVYLLAGDEHLMLIDSGLDSTPREFVFPYLEKAGCSHRSIDFILTTHADIDHMGGNASLREHFPTSCFMAHRLDREWIEDVERIIRENYGQFDADHGTRPDPVVNEWIRSQTRATHVDVELFGGERVRLSRDWWIEIRHTPGHTRGHLSVIDPRSNTAIIADAALSDAIYTRSGQSAFAPTYRFVEDYVRTARELLRLAPDIVLTSHYPVLRRDEARLFLQTTIDYTERVQRELLALLEVSPKPLSLSQIIEKLAAKLGTWPASANPFLMYPLAGHLELLEQRGVVRKSRESGILVYSRISDGHHQIAT